MGGASVHGRVAVAKRRCGAVFRGRRDGRLIAVGGDHGGAGLSSAGASCSTVAGAAAARAAAAAMATAGRGPIGIGAGVPAWRPLPAAGWATGCAGPTVPDRSTAGSTSGACSAASAWATTRSCSSTARSGARPAQSRSRLSSRAWAK